METYYTLQKLSCAHLLLTVPEKVFHHPYYFHSRQRTHTHDLLLFFISGKYIPVSEINTRRVTTCSCRQNVLHMHTHV